MCPCQRMSRIPPLPLPRSFSSITTFRQRFRPFTRYRRTLTGFIYSELEHADALSQQAVFSLLGFRNFFTYFTADFWWVCNNIYFAFYLHETFILYLRTTEQVPNHVYNRAGGFEKSRSIKKDADANKTFEFMHIVDE